MSFKYSVLLVSSVALLFGGCVHPAAKASPALFGGDFAAIAGAAERQVDVSPDGRFACESVFEPKTCLCELWLVGKADGRRLLLGRNERGIGAKWATTQLGDLLIVENFQDPDHSEAYVVRPRVVKGRLVCETLYASPSNAPCAWNHSYAEIKKVTPDGLMTVELSWWDDGRKGSGNRMTVIQPLFRGDKSAVRPNNYR